MLVPVLLLGVRLCASALVRGIVRPSMRLVMPTRWLIAPSLGLAAPTRGLLVPSRRWVTLCTRAVCGQLRARLALQTRRADLDVAHTQQLWRAAAAIIGAEAWIPAATSTITIPAAATAAVPAAAATVVTATATSVPAAATVVAAVAVAVAAAAAAARF